jgi:bacteriocin biosynthesis cyclodehydratase domain-containing protein
MRPQLALPFTIVPDRDAVWLIAGEDIRFALRGEGAASWLPAVLQACDGRRTLDEVVALAPAARQAEARELVVGLVGERVVIDANAATVHRAQPPTWSVDGSGRLADMLRERASGGPIRVHAQDTLELANPLAANKRCLADGTSWLWTTIGPQARAFLSPLFLPDAGPCLECLVDHFRLRSPAPEVYDLTAKHTGPFAAATFDDAALAVVAHLVTWKLSLASREPASAALYALHVVEIATLEVSSHRVWINPECPACATRGT